MLQSSPLSTAYSSSGEPLAKQGPSPFSVYRESDQQSLKTYRPSKPMPYELQERCRIFFEENLYSQAFALLNSLLTAGYVTHGVQDLSAAFVPPSSYLALAATMAVHPTMTTRTRRSEKIQASIQALQYLRLLEASVGPLNARFNKAYAFPYKYLLTRRGGTSRRDVENLDTTEITLGLAESGSLWSQAGDFWAVAGWAFNCSIEHPKRWDIWLPWLEHMIDVIESDWLMRQASTSWDESLIMKYIDGHNSRRILRALFADGSKSSLAEFHEIWKKETADKKPKAEAAYEKMKVDFETEEFGRYFNASDESSEDDTALKTMEELGDDGDEDEDANFIDDLSHPTIPDGAEMLGGVVSLHLRMRLFALLLQITMQWPEQISDAATLLGLFETYVRGYQLPLFVSIISAPQLNFFPRAAASLMVQSIAANLLESAAPRPMGDDLTQAILETNYLPWAASTAAVADNAKLAACIETLTRLLDRECGLRWTTKLEAAVQEGIKRREDKARKDGRKRGDSANVSSDDMNWLVSSGQRMALVLKLAYRRADLQKSPPG